MKSKLIQIASAFLVGVIAYIGAFSNAWTSYTIQLLESDSSPLGYKITHYEKSLVGSIAMLGSVPGVWAVGFLINKLGPKRTEILCGLGNALAWALIATAKSVTLVIVARFLIGFFCGMHLVTAIVFISEISQITVRGSLVCILNLMYHVGTLISYIEGYYCSYDVINYLSLVVTVGFTLAMICMKDTPGYLIRTGREKEALTSLKFYRGISQTNQEVLEEFSQMKNQQNEIIQNNDLKLSKLHLETENLTQEHEMQHQITEQSLWKIFRSSKSTQRALVIISAQIIMIVFMGMIVIQAYAGLFFIRASPNLSPDFCSVLLAIVILVSTGLSVIVTDLISRRMLMISTSALATLCMALLASMLRWSWAPQWGIPLVMVCYCTIYHLGVNNLPFVQMSECFSPQIKSFTSTIILSCMFVSNFVVLLVYHTLVELIDLDGMFLVFSFIGAVNTLISFFYMKETRLMPLEVIQQMFEEGYIYRKPQR